MNSNSLNNLRKVLCVVTVIVLCFCLASFCTMVSFAEPNESNTSSVSAPASSDGGTSSTEIVSSEVISESNASSEEINTSSEESTSSAASVSSAASSTSSKKVTSSKKSTTSKKSSGGYTTYKRPSKNQDKINKVEAFDDSKVTKEEHDKVIEEGESGIIISGGRSKYYTYGKIGLIISSSIAVCLGIALLVTNLIYNKKYRPFDDVAKMKRENRKAKKAKKQRAKANKKRIVKKVAKKK